MRAEKRENARYPVLMKLQVTLTVEQGDVDDDTRFLRVCRALELVRQMGELVTKSDGEVTVSESAPGDD